MATVVQVPYARLRHADFTPLIPGTPTTVAARCECGATWALHPTDPRRLSFAQWAMTHLGPHCGGSGELIHEGNTINGHGQCPTCRLIHDTTPAAGYEGWRYMVTHVEVVA